MSVPIWWIMCMYWVQGWGLLSRFHPFRCFPIFSTSPNYMLNIEYYVHIWQVHLSAVLTPVKYESHSKNATSTFVKSKIWHMDKLTNGALVTPTPGPMEGWPSVIIGQNGFGWRNTGNTDTPTINPLGPGECLLSGKKWSELYMKRHLNISVKGLGHQWA